MRCCIFYTCLFVVVIGALSAFKLAIRVCFKDNTRPSDTSECAYCDPRRLQRTMGNCTRSQDGLPGDTVWNELQKRCILRTCRQQYPSQKILPTLMPLSLRRNS